MTRKAYIALSMAAATIACPRASSAMFFATGTFSAEKYELYQPGLDLNLNNFQQKPSYNLSAGFAGAGYDWSGVGNNAAGVQLFSLVSPVHIFSAWHHQLRNPACQFVTRDETVLALTSSKVIGPRQPVTGQDLMINNLARAITPKDKVSVLRLLDISTKNYDGQPAFIVGKRNGKQVVVAPTTVRDGGAYSMLYFDTANPSGSYWEGGDSGSPMLIPYRGQLTLTGAAWYPSSICSLLPSPTTGWSPTASVNATLATDGYALRWTIYDVPSDTVKTASRWTGASSGVFGTASNWSGGVAPSDRPVVFTGDSANGRTALTLSANANVRGMLFNTSTGAGFTFSGVGRTLTVGATGIRNEDSKTQTFNTAIALSNSQNWEAAFGGLTFNSTISNGGYLLVVGGAKNTTINGAISGSGGLAKDDTGTLTVNAASTYTGTTFLHNGTIKLGADNALGTAGRLWFDANNPAKLDLNGKTQAFEEIASIRDGTGVIHLGTGGKLTTGSNNFSSVYAGSFTGTGAITKVGSGTWVLSGNSSNSGSLVVDRGTLLVNGTMGDAAVRIKSGATLRGTGSLGGPVTLDSGAALAPGEGGVESLAMGDLTWNGGAKLVFDLNGTTSDLIDLGDGGFNKGSNGSFLIEFANTAASTSATFTLLTFGSSDFQVSDFTYLTRSGTALTGRFVLTPDALQFVTGVSSFAMVPEPSSTLVLAAAAGLATLRRRSRPVSARA